MLELPEVLCLVDQFKKELTGKKVKKVSPPSKEHKFCWYNGDPQCYDEALRGSTVVSAEGFGMYSEIIFDNGLRLALDDGINSRLIPPVKEPKSYQLKIDFEDGTSLVFTVAMYGGIQLHDDKFDNGYYLNSRKSISPLSEGFKKVFNDTFAGAKPTLSAKAFIATEQRFPGVGNGVCQDILFEAGINPKTKIATFSEDEKDRLFHVMVNVLKEMGQRGGRDTEKDLYGNSGGYITKLSRNTLGLGCPKCGGEIIKEAYLGGSVYYCPKCQPIVK